MVIVNYCLPLGTAERLANKLGLYSFISQPVVDRTPRRLCPGTGLWMSAWSGYRTANARLVLPVSSGVQVAASVFHWHQAITYTCQAGSILTLVSGALQRTSEPRGAQKFIYYKLRVEALPRGKIILWPAEYIIQWNLSVTTTSIITFITCDLFSNVF